MRKLSIVAASLVLAACATVSRIEPTGGDTYFISATAAPARGGIEGAAHLAYRDAGAFCVKQGGELEVISEETGHDFPAAGREILRFRCKQTHQT